MASLKESFRVLLGMLAVCSVILLPTLVGRETGVPFAPASWREVWLVRLLLNLMGYATVALPVFCLVQYLRHVEFDRQESSNVFSRFLRVCAFGDNGSGDGEVASGSPTLPATSVSWLNPPRGTPGHYLLLMGCFAGLQASYLTWGVLQERIITHDYDGERFRDSQFLVFTNRALAGVVAATGLLLIHQPPHRAPIVQYAYSSFSNILSSWCQYEALKFVSFPTQVLAKACKILPVMLMGKIVNRRSYDATEYLTAGMISAGVAIFLLASSESHHHSAVTTASGVLLLIGYMMFDAFTSNWQDALFRRYHMSPLQMMLGVNAWSCLLTLTSLVEQGSFGAALSFSARHWAFCGDILLLSFCSAVGQLFIFFTISQFGAVTFIIIMTTRQAFAILLSCLIYGHPVNLRGSAGIALVFLALFLRIYARQRKQTSTAVPLQCVTTSSTSK